MKKIVLFTVASLIAFIFACEKDLQPLKSKQKVDVTKFNYIGKMHNEALKFVLENTTQLPTNKEIPEHVHRLVKEFLPRDYSIFENNRKQMSEEVELMITAQKKVDAFEYIKTLKISKELKHLLNQMMNTINQGMPLNSLQEELSKLENSGIQTLNDGELTILLSSTSVAKYSAKFWYPASLGGEGGIKYLKIQPKQSFGDYDYGVETDPEETLEERRIRLNWAKIIGVDAISVVGAAAMSIVESGGASAIPNPLLGGMPTAGAIGLIGGAVGSAAEVISQW